MNASPRVPAVLTVSAREEITMALHGSEIHERRALTNTHVYFLEENKCTLSESRLHDSKADTTGFGLAKGPHQVSGAIKHSLSLSANISPNILLKGVTAHDPACPSLDGTNSTVGAGNP